MAKYKLPACLKFCIYTTLLQICDIGSQVTTKFLDMFRIITLKQHKLSQSDPVLVPQFTKKLQSDLVLIRAHLCNSVLYLAENWIRDTVLFVIRNRKLDMLVVETLPKLFM